MDMPAGKDPMKMAAERVSKFIVRGLLILLSVYLFNSMKRYAINYTGEDTWFTTFAVIVVAIPIAEIFCILGLILPAPIRPVRSPKPCTDCVCACTTAANGQVPKVGVEAIFLDPDMGDVDYTTAPLQEDVGTKMAAMFGMTDDDEKMALDMEAERTCKCIVRGLLVLLWVYLVDLLRRFVTTLCAEAIILTICPLGILAISVFALFCFLMESL